MQVHCLCEVCGFWMAFEEFTLHHLNTGGMGMGGDDTLENTIATHKLCHPP